VSPPDIPARPGPVEWSASSETELGSLFAEVVRHLPEFVPRYVALVEAGDEDPGEPMVLMELAGFVADRLRVVGAEGSALSRALGLVEALLAAREGDDVGVELVGYAFFDSFTLEDRRRLTPRLGQRSLDLLESLEMSPGEAPGG
jgi:hypothetical protein